jgi:hypothetical protein
MNGGSREFVLKMKDPKIDYSLYYEWKEKLSQSIDSSEGVQNKLSLDAFKNC